MRGFPVALAFAACVVATTVHAGAQPAPTETDPSGEADARRHFEVGIELFRRELWEAALGEFERSSALFPTRPAAKNTALCLRRLGRAAEALEVYERLREGMPADDLRVVDDAIAQLSTRVGWIELSGGPDGAQVSVDGRARGALPITRSLRATVGAVTVRVYKPGFLPFEQRVDIVHTKTATVVVRLVALARSGTLRVVEAAGLSASVVLDGAVVGKTPWEGLAAIGRHTLVLRGTGDHGTAPFEVVVRDGATIDVSRLVEPLPSALRLAVQPRRAAISVDGVTVGTSQWEGRLPAGRHVVVASAPGHLDATREIVLERGQDADVALTLSPAAAATRPSRWYVEPALGAVLAPTLGGDVIDGCSGQEGCDRSLGLGVALFVHGGWRHGSGFGASLVLGGLSVAQSTSGRESRIYTEGLSEPSTARLDDDLRMSVGLAGASVSAELGDRFPVLLRLGAGMAVGSLTDARSGSYTSRLPQPGIDGQSFALELEPAHSETASWVFAMPELRVGVRLARGVVLGAGVATAVMIAVSEPTWPASRRQVQQPDGLMHFDDERLGGPAMVLVVPELALAIER